MDIASCNSGGNQTAVYSANKIQDNNIPVETTIKTPIMPSMFTVVSWLPVPLV